MRTIRTPKKDERFLRALADGKAVSIACQSAGYSRSSVYEYRKADPDFSRLWTEATDEAVERLEAEVDRRGLEGVEEPVFYQGKQIGAIRRYSDTLLMFRLKALRPEKYRENHKPQDPDDSYELARKIRLAIQGMDELTGGTISPSEDAL